MGDKVSLLQYQRPHSHGDGNLSRLQTIIWIVSRIPGQVLYLAGSTALLIWLEGPDELLLFSEQQSICFLIESRLP